MRELLLGGGRETGRVFCDFWICSQQQVIPVSCSKDLLVVMMLFPEFNKINSVFRREKSTGFIDELQSALDLSITAFS